MVDQEVGVKVSNLCEADNQVLTRLDTVIVVVLTTILTVLGSKVALWQLHSRMRQPDIVVDGLIIIAVFLVSLAVAMLFNMYEPWLTEKLAGDNLNCHSDKSGKFRVYTVGGTDYYAFLLNRDSFKGINGNIGSSEVTCHINIGKGCFIGVTTDKFAEFNSVYSVARFNRGFTFLLLSKNEYEQLMQDKQVSLDLNIYGKWGWE